MTQWLERLRRNLALVRRFTPDLAGHKRALILVLALSLLAAACQIALPWPIQWVIDGALARKHATAHGPAFYIWTGAAALTAIVLLQALLDYATSMVTADVCHRVSRSLRSRLFQHMSQLSPRFYAKYKSGDLLVRLLGDVGMVRSVMVETSTEVLTRGLWIGGTVAVMFWVDWRLTLTLFAVLPLVAWVVQSTSRRIEVQAGKARRKEGALADMMQETLAASEVIQALGRANEIVHKVAQSSRSSERAGLRSARLSAQLSSSVHALLGIGVAITLLLGSRRVAAEQLKLGELIVFITYVRGVLKPVRSASRNSEKLAKGAACAQRLIEVLDQPIAVQSKPGAPPAAEHPRSLEFVEVDFRYEEERDALIGFSERFQRGELVGLFGRSGAGKSTVAALCVRLFDPCRGSVRLDGVDLRELDLASVRARFGLCLQRPALLGETIRENLALGATDASDEQMWQALDDAGASDFVRALPQGLDTGLGSYGVGLSGGQERRIALARTLLRDSPVLIVDEPFAGLDRQTALHVLATLRVRARNAIVVVIAHEVEFLGEYDQVVLIDGGRVRARGTHEELVATNDDYRMALSAPREVFA